jgi:hypothetical protein
MQEQAASTTESASRVHANQLELQRAAFRAFIELSAGVAEPENARLEKEYASARGALGQGYDRLIDRLTQDARTVQAKESDKLQEQLYKGRCQHNAQLAALDVEYQKRRQRTTDEMDSALRDARKQLEQDLWLADSVADASSEQIQREREKLDKQAPSLTRRLEQVQERADWTLAQLRYRPPADGPSEEPPTFEDPAKAVEDLYVESLEQLANLERLVVPSLVVGFAPYALGALLCGTLVAIAGILSFLDPHTFSFAWTGPTAFGLGLAFWLIGWRVLGRLSQSKLRSVAAPLRQTLTHARAAIEQHLRAQRDRLDQRENRAIHKRSTEMHRGEEKHENEIVGIEHRRGTTLGRLEETYLKAKLEFEASRDSNLAQMEEKGRRSLEELRRRYERRLSRLATRREREIAALDRRHAEDRKHLEEKWGAAIARLEQLTDQAARLEALAPAWDNSAWPQWRPTLTFTPTIRFGEWELDLSQIARCVRERTNLGTLIQSATHANSRVRVPAVLELPDRCSLLVQTGQKNRDEAVDAIQATMARLLTSLPPGRVHFTIIDPVGLGENFAGFMHLADYDDALVGGRIWTEKGHIEQRLSDLTAHMENVIQKYLRNEFETIDAYNVQAGELAEPYRFLVIADFPANFTDESIQRLASIVNSGPRCGVYTLIAHDTRLPLPPGYTLEDLQLGSVHVVAKDDRFAWQDDVLKRFPLTLDTPPDQERLTGLMHKVGQAAGRAKRVEVPFEFITPPPDQLWTGDSRSEIRVPIGRSGAVRLQDLRLGRGVAQHALIAGKTGSGKSTLLHVLITNLVLWYPPDEVEFYLIDFKKGVEFKTYATHELPHARAIAIESDREFGLSVLHRLDSEMERRGELFRHAGVQDVAAYRDATGKKLPRTLLVVDEFQVFFSEDDKIAQDAAILLDRLVRQGRAFGIHTILGSQTLGGTSGLARSTIGQMAVRIALQCSETDSQLILEDGNSAARLLSRPGEAIYNDAGGLLQGNSPFQTAWISDEIRDANLDRLTTMTREQGILTDSLIVFEGNAPADLRRNRALMDLLRNWSSPNPESVSTELAAGQSPNAEPRFWLGDAVAIKDPTAAVLRKQSGANLLLIGQRDDAALAIMSAGFIGLSAQHPRKSARFVVLDGSASDAPQMLQRIGSILPHESRIVEYRDVAESLSDLVNEVRRRQGEGTPADPAVYVLIYGLQRYRVLRKSEDSFSFSYSSGGDEEKPPAADRLLAELLREGPVVGIHTIAWADTPATVERTFERATLREFDNRVLFQMSAADSSNLIDSPLANRLGFYRALFFSEEQGLLEKFRPYSLPDREFLEELRTSMRVA